MISRTILRRIRCALFNLDSPWRYLLVGMGVGVLGALAVEIFRTLLFAVEMGLVSAHDGHLVPAARELEPEIRLLVPVIGGPAVGMLLWLAENEHPSRLSRTRGDYIEAVVIGDGRLNLRSGVLKILASLVVVSTGGAVGREGAMILLSAMASSSFGRLAGDALDLRLMVSCGAAAGLAAAYHTPLAGAVFVAEILLGSLALAQLGPVVVASVVSHGITISLVGSGVRFPMAATPTIGTLQVMIMLAFAPVSGVAGAALLYWLKLARRSFIRLNLPLPLPLMLGGLIVGLLSLWHPEVWGNGDSGIRQQIHGMEVWQTVALVLFLKLLAVAATTGSGAPGGVFTPTLFVGAAFGALLSAVLTAFGLASTPEPIYAMLGMATLLAGTTHAPVMAALMVSEMTGQYSLLSVFLPACVVATLVSQHLHPQSIYGLSVPAEELKP